MLSALYPRDCGYPAAVALPAASYPNSLKHFNKRVMLVLPVLINLHALFKKALIAISACRWVKSVMANAARLLVYGGSGRFIIRLMAKSKSVLYRYAIHIAHFDRFVCAITLGKGHRQL